MKIEALWLFVLIQTITAYSQPGFGRSYLRNSRLCHQWSCLNTKLGLLDSLPTSEQLGTVLRRLLPPEWHGAVESVLNTCYYDRPRRYTNTCPGQAIMHCAVDQLIANCPESFQRKEDACAPLNSLAGFPNMFTQSRYENIERNMVFDRRPAWFLKNYFNTKCCNLPALFNATILSECGFSAFIQYYIHNPTMANPEVLPAQRHFMTTTPTENISPTTDPLDCCDLSEFIEPSWRQECNFQLSWGGQSRLVIKNEPPLTSTTAEPPRTSSPVVRNDVAIVPQTCEKETCVFTKLNIITNGSVDVDAFTRLLDNLTASQPSWTKAKGRVLTSCLMKPLQGYEGQCEINKLLACTFDVLTENCPNTTKNDLCKHTMTERTCQISSSKYKAKQRRKICPLPELVERSVLSECGLSSISRTEPVTTVIKPKTYRLFTSKDKCQDLTPSTTCLLSKMGVLNKYGFLDYFKMKDRIRNYTADKGPTFEGVYMDAFNTGLLYNEHCNSAKKFLNLLDSMLMICPKQSSKNSTQCATIVDQIYNSPINRDVPQDFSQRILDHFLHVYNASAQTTKAFQPRHIKKIKKYPVYYGILNSKNAPKVTIIDVKPKSSPKALVEKPPLVLLPVYMRVPHSNLMIRRPFVENGVMRSSFPTNNPMNQAHISSLPKLVSTVRPISTIEPVFTTQITKQSSSTTKPDSTTQRVSTRFVSTNDEKLKMIKPE